MTKFWIGFGWIWSTLVSYSNFEDALAGLFLDRVLYLWSVLDRYRRPHFQGHHFGTTRLRILEISMAYYYTFG